MINYGSINIFIKFINIICFIKNIAFLSKKFLHAFNLYHAEFSTQFNAYFKKNQQNVVQTT